MTWIAFLLMKVMATPGINSSKTSSNHVVEVEKVLGIEAARKTIMQEIKVTSLGREKNNLSKTQVIDVDTFKML